MSQMTLQCCGPYERQRLISTACLSEKKKKKKKKVKSNDTDMDLRKTVDVIW